MPINKEQLEMGVTYEVKRTEQGFQIVSEKLSKGPIDVLCQEQGLTIENTESGSSENLGLFEFHKLMYGICRESISQQNYPEQQRHWQIKRLSQRLYKDVLNVWRATLAELPETILNIQRALYAASPGNHRNAVFDGLANNAYAVRDIVQLRAAAHALLNLDTLIRFQQKNAVEHSPEYQALQNIAKEYHRNVLIGHIEIDDTIRIAYFSHWPDLYAPDGRTYRSLNRTLAALPGGLPSRLLCQLPKLQLHKPYTERLPLLLLLLWSIQHDRHPEAGHYDVIANADTASIKRAMQRLATSRHIKLSSRRTVDVNEFVQTLLDYPEATHGGIVGLTDACIDWHRAQNERTLAELLDRLGEDQATQRPPIELPSSLHIHFLERTHAVIQEGQEMQHCISSYAKATVQGHCYLFHIDYQDTQATVEVSPQGHIVQSKGPHNKPTAASVWGRKQLKAWGKPLNTTNNSSTDNDSDIPF